MKWSKPRFTAAGARILKVHIPKNRTAQGTRFKGYTPGSGKCSLSLKHVSRKAHLLAHNRRSLPNPLKRKAHSYGRGRKF